MANDSSILKEYSININDYNPHAFCLIRVELDEDGKPCDWTFLYCNDALAKLEGRPKEKIIGHRFFELFPNGSRKWLKPYYESAYEGKTYSTNVISEELDKYFQIESFPTDEKGVCACVLRDIKSEIVKREQHSKELQQTIEKLEEEKQINARVRQYASAMGIVYPLAISLDYLKNEYHMLEYEQFLNKTAKWSGTVDELIEVEASTIPDEEYAEKFKGLFGREKALEAFCSGEKELTLKHPQWCDEGKIHWMETKVICLECSDIKASAISVSRCIDDEKQLEEMQNIFAASRLGSWSIYLQDGKEPRMEADDIMCELLGIADKNLTHEEIYTAWFSNITPGAVQTVLDCVDRLKKGARDEITYLWKHPVLGERYVRCGGTAMPVEGGFVLRGYHYDVDDVVREQKKKDEALAEQAAIIDALSRSFRNVFVANIKDGKARAIRLADSYKVKAVRDIEGTDFDFDAVVDRWIRETVHPDDRDKMKAALNIQNVKKVLSKQEEFVGNYRNIEDGVVHHYQYVFRRIGDTDNVVAGFKIIDSIIEEQEAKQRRERELIEAEQKRLQTINAIGQAYSSIYAAYLDTQEIETVKVAGAGNNFYKLGALSKAQKLEHMKKYVAEPYLKETIEFIDLNTVADRLVGQQSLSYIFQTADGSWMQSLIVPQRYDANGKVDMILLANRDVTEEKNKELEQQKVLIHALAMAQQANKAKTTFLNSMSHDIRTPMNAIIGFTALAQSHIDDQGQVQDYLGKISISSTHLLSLINDILDMSRIESGTVKLEEKAVHIPDILHDLRTMIQSLVNSKNLNIFIDTQDVVHEDVLTDKLRLNQVLLNIVSNAIKFTQPGGDIIIRLVEKPCSLKQYTTYEFSVKDTGIGMSQEFIGHIFETFTRERSSTVSGIQGTGLGMAITKNIVDMMGGQIQVESQVGKGSRFTVTLNLRLADAPVKNEPIPALLGARALIVDDDMDTCRSVSKMLYDIQMRPDWTTSGKEAVVRAQDAAERKDEYKIYIIDYLMPDMNGIETVRRIRRVVSEDVPIIVLTAYDWTDFEKEAREAGVTAFVSKPIFMSELRAVLTHPAETEEAHKKENKKTYDYSNKRILLVEDNALNREIAIAILEETGMTIDCAEDGDIAVSIINREPAGKYDLVLMDIQMPKMDGYTATREIRTLPDNTKANIPIVAMTANAFDEDRKKAFKAGMNGHIIKPISIDEIARVLDKIFALNLK